MESKTQKQFDESALDHSGETFIEEGPWKLSQQYANSLVLTDITNALKVGKECQGYAINVWPASPAALHNFWNKAGGTPEKVWEYLEALDFAENYSEKMNDAGSGEITLTVYRRSVKGVRMYSPFALANMKPLKEIPSKWTVRHAIRALVNKQVEGVRKNYYLTDDYAGDAASNFRKGEIDPIDLARQVMEAPDGWWSSLDGNSVKLVCHTFDSNSFTLKL